MTRRHVVLTSFRRFRPWLSAIVVVVLLAGAAGDAPLAQDLPTMPADDVLAMLKAGERFLLVDVRSQQEFEVSHIEGAVNMPAFALKHRKFPDDMPVVLYDDGSGSTDASDAAQALETSGHYQYHVLDGGLLRWDILAYPAVKPRGMTRAPLVKPISPRDLARLIERQGSRLAVLDVRPAEQYAQARVPGAMSFSAKDPGDRLANVPKQNIVVVYDDGSGNSVDAARKLRREGYRGVRVLYGGLPNWLNQDLPVED